MVTTGTISRSPVETSRCDNSSNAFRILLTGASGYLGQHILASLFQSSSHHEQHSYEIYALYHRAEGFAAAVSTAAAQFPTTKVHVQALDLSDQRAVRDWFARIPILDVCIHTAALSSPRTCQAQPELAHNSNCPKAFLDALLEVRNTYVIALSTDQVYDGTEPPYREDTPPEPCNVYGRTKLALEHHLLQSNNCRTLILRSSIILGPRAPVLPEIAHETFLHFCATRQGVDTVFYRDEVRSVVSVHDVVAVILGLLASFRNGDTVPTGVYNMGGPTAVSRVDMAELVFEHLGYNPQHILAKDKAAVPPSADSVPSPLNIAMDSSLLYQYTKRSFSSVKNMVESTFPKGSDGSTLQHV